jgi:hypothetical protein
LVLLEYPFNSRDGIFGLLPIFLRNFLLVDDGSLSVCRLLNEEIERFAFFLFLFLFRSSLFKFRHTLFDFLFVVSNNLVLVKIHVTNSKVV